MATLLFQEKRTVEEYFITMGFVIDFSDRTFHDFVGDVTGLDINDPKYSVNNSGSKGNRLREFIRIEDDYTVGKLIAALHEYLERKETTGNVKVIRNYDSLKRLHERLLTGGIVENIDAIKANNDDKDFHQLVKLIKESISKNEPEAALDRLHTFLIKFVKELCKSHGVQFEKEESVNAIFGKYIKAIRSKGLIESDMAEKIVQATFQVIQAFNDIRNNKSFAHDNPVLNYDESVLIFSHVTATVKFIQSLEAKAKNAAIAEAKPDWGEF